MYLLHGLICKTPVMLGSLINVVNTKTEVQPFLDEVTQISIRFNITQLFSTQMPLVAGKILKQRTSADIWMLWYMTRWNIKTKHTLQLP